MSACPHNCFNPTLTASNTAAFAGVLAGFAFVAIVLFLDSGRGSESTNLARSRTLEAFVVAFIGLLLATFNYGAVAGEVRTDHRVAVELYLAGVLLAISVMQLFLAIVFLTRDRLHDRVPMLEVTASVVVPALAFAYLATTAVDGISIDDPSRRAWSQTAGWLHTFLIALLPIVTAAIYILRVTIAGKLRRVLRARGARGRRSVARASTIAALNRANLISIFVAAVIAVAAGERRFDQGWSWGMYSVASTAMFLLLVGNCVVIAVTSTSMTTETRRS
jgi:hypothetical protein